MLEHMAIGIRSRLLVAGCLVGVLGGCAYAPDKHLVTPTQELPVTDAPMPHSSGPNPKIIAALACMQKSGVLSNLHFAIAVHADGTGKSISASDGATGSILPQGTSAIWAAQAVMLAGGVAQNYYELNTESAVRKFGGTETDKALTDKNIADQPQFVVSTAFTALDFLGGPDLDMRIAGIGPQAQRRGASLEVSAEIYRLGDRTTLAISSLSRQVLYNYAGLNVASTVSAMDNTLVTGGISWTDQERIQEASRDMIALSVADVLSRVPNTPPSCRAAVEDLLVWNNPNAVPVATPAATKIPVPASTSSAGLPQTTAPAPATPIAK